MSWAEVFKINSNMTKPLNTLMTELISSVTTLLNTVNTNVTSVNTNVTNTKTQVGTVNTAVSNVNTAVGNVNTAVSNVNTAVSNVNTAVGTANTKLTQISTQMRDSKVVPFRVVTSTTTYTPEKTGTYMVICVGAGGDAGGRSSSSSTGIVARGGGGGGVAIKTLRLLSTTSYNITVGTTASFGSVLSATAGQSDSSGGEGGTGSGGDSNYSGSKGGSYSSGNTNVAIRGGGVGVSIAGLSEKYSSIYSNMVDFIVDMQYGDSLLSYGGGAPTLVYRDDDYYSVSKKGLPAAVIIIPIELEG